MQYWDQITAIDIRVVDNRSKQVVNMQVYLLHRHIPVSYTHLDVYKRQMLTQLVNVVKN